MFYRLAGRSEAVIHTVMKRGVKAELCRPLTSVKEDMEGEERRLCVHRWLPNQHVLSKRGQRGFTSLSRHKRTSQSQIQPHCYDTDTITHGREGGRHTESLFPTDVLLSFQRWKQLIRLRSRSLPWLSSFLCRFCEYLKIYIWNSFLIFSNVIASDGVILEIVYLIQQSKNILCT